MAHSVAQVQLAPTGLKSISSSHYLKRGKKREKERERGQREERRKVRTEEVKQVLYCLYSLKPHLFIQSREKDELGRGREKKKKISEKKNKERRFMLPAWILTKLLLWTCWKFEKCFIESYAITYCTCVSEDDTVCPETRLEKCPTPAPTL